MKDTENARNDGSSGARIGTAGNAVPNAVFGGRIPPHSQEAERALLGSILQDPKNALPVAELRGIVPSSFFVTAHELIYQAIADLAASVDTPIDIITVADRLRQTGQLDAVGGEDELMRIVDSTPTAAHAEYYAERVADSHLRRRVISAAAEATKQAFDTDTDAEGVLSRVEQDFLSLRTRPRNEIPWAEAIDREMKEIARIVDEKKGVTGLSTGFVGLDLKLQGLHNGDMIVLAARPSMGKTSLAMNIAENVALGARNMPPVPVCIFSLEMNTASLVRRMLCGRARVPSHNLAFGAVGKEGMQNLDKARHELARAPIYVDDTSGIEAPAMLSAARRIKSKHGIGLFVIDYLQLMNYNRFAREGRQRETAAISQAVKGMAKELDVPVIVLSQLSRNPESRDRNAVPRLSDLRDSGAIEQDADVVLLLRRPCVYDKSIDDKRLAIVDVAKHRNGQIGEVKMDFDNSLTRFSDRAEGEDDIPADDPAG
jgi:replicative DNA helicase